MTTPPTNPTTLHFISFREFSQSSYNVFITNGSKYTTITAMFFAHQYKERTLLSLKRRVCEMNCTHCLLQSKVGNIPSVPTDIFFFRYKYYSSNKETFIHKQYFHQAQYQYPQSERPNHHSPQPTSGSKYISTYNHPTCRTFSGTLSRTVHMRVMHWSILPIWDLNRAICIKMFHSTNFKWCTVEYHGKRLSLPTQYCILSP